MDIKKRDDENTQQFLWRIGGLKDSGVVTKSWDELTPILNSETSMSRNSDAWRKEYAIAKRYKTNVFDIDDLGFDKNLIKAEVLKKQAQTKNTETNRWLREYSRDQLIIEEINQHIDKLTPIEIPDPLPEVLTSRCGVICFGDEHFGTQFEIVGLDGKVINSYNDKVFYDRMNRLLSKSFDIIQENHLTDVYVFELGDFCDGILRTSQLMKLQYGLLESTVKYAEYISEWLTKLSQRVRIHFQMTPGNHTELRLLGERKGTFSKENLDIVVRAFIKERLKHNPNFDIVENPTGYIYADIFGKHVLGIHGEVSNTNNVTKDFSETYGVHIDYIFAGHKHHFRNIECGRNSEFIGVPSIIGIDDYSMSLNATSNPGATFLIFEDGVGKTVQYFIKL